MVLFFAIALLVISCTKDNSIQTVVDSEDKIPVYENGAIISYVDNAELRIPTEKEMEIFYKKGWLSTTKALNCEWADGVGGSVNCDGGTCGVVIHNNGDGTQTVGLGCYYDGEIHHTGAYRN